MAGPHGYRRLPERASYLRVNDGLGMHLLTTARSTGPQGPPPLGSPTVAPARHCSHPPRWPLPRQARSPPQDPRAGCPARHRSLQDQRRSPTTSQLTIRHRHLLQDRPEGLRPEQDRRGLASFVLRPRQGQGQGQRGCVLPAGREASGTISSGQ